MISQFYKLFQNKWKDIQTFWIISDTHFSDEELKCGIPNRPSDEELLKKINSKVGKKDLIFILGDVGNIEFAKKLKGYKVLVCGNHDVGHTVYEEVFDEVYSGPLMIGEKIILSHEPLNGINWALNIHGHNHQPKGNDTYHLNVCADVIGYEPLNMNQLMKQGLMSKIPNVHRITIDGATERKRKRGDKPIRGQRSKVQIYDDYKTSFEELYIN